MHLYGTRVFEQQDETASEMIAKPARGQAGYRLRAFAAVVLALTTGMPSGFAQQATDKTASELPAAPTPTPTETLNLRQQQRDFTKPAAGFRGNPINMYRPTTIAKASFDNSVRLDQLVKDGKIYLSLSDAIALALENNYDIAIARYYLDIADTDIALTKTGAAFRGVGAGVLANTLGGSSQTLAASGAPGGLSNTAAAGANGVTLSTDGAGPAPELLDPTLGGTFQFERAESPANGLFQPREFTNTDSYDFTYNQGFVTGTSLATTFNNSRITTNGLSAFSPQLSSNFKATVTQHLLQGAGIWVNKRYMYEALLNRKITDSTFRQQILYTVNQVENIYWVLVSAYEDVQAKTHAVEQSTKLLGDTRKQLEIGTMAPLDVVSAQSTVATDRQALINSQNNLNYQQLIIKQAIARNLNDPALVAAPVIPTDRVNLDLLPEEQQTPEELTKQAFENRPELEQAVLSLKKDAITLKGARNAMLPVLDAYGFYGASGVGGSPNQACNFEGISCASTTTSGYSTIFGDLFNSSSPDKGLGFNLQIPLRNRAAQAVQARSMIEYRQAELHLEQLYTEIHMQVVNAQLALTNDREQVKAATAARDFNQQSLDAEQKKLHLGASTTANVLLQQRNLSQAENNLIAANASYAQARAALYQMLASTLQHYGINLNDATAGVVKSAPVVPGLEPVKDAK
jgi:outer membrane protein TolC